MDPTGQSLMVALPLYWLTLKTTISRGRNKQLRASLEWLNRNHQILIWEPGMKTQLNQEYLSRVMYLHIISHWVLAESKWLWIHKIKRTLTSWESGLKTTFTTILHMIASYLCTCQRSEITYSTSKFSLTKALTHTLKNTT